MYLKLRINIQFNAIQFNSIQFNSILPVQFNECFLFFYLDYIVRLGQFLRDDSKLLLEGHIYSVCDRQFGTIQTLFKKKKRNHSKPMGNRFGGT